MTAMKILAINASPHKCDGATGKLLHRFLEGARESGSVTQVIHAYDLRIMPCRGCLTCWNQIPGRCVYSDDMKHVLPILLSADAWILATPVYADGMAGIMKMMLERTLSILKPEVAVVESRSSHPRKKSLRVRHVGLIATCGLWEADHFHPLIMHIEALCRNLGAHVAGTFCRPHALFLRKAGGRRDSVFAAIWEAGRQFGAGKEISSSLETEIAQPLVSLEKYVDVSNQCQQWPVVAQREVVSTQEASSAFCK